MFISLIVYIIAITLFLLICSLYRNRRFKNTSTANSKKVDRYIYFSSDDRFLSNSFKILSTHQTSSCSNKTISKYPCANFHKLGNMSNAPLIFRTNYRLLNRSRNGYIISNKILHMFNTTQFYIQINVTTYAFGFKNVVVSRYGTIHSKCWNIGPAGACLCQRIPTNIIYSTKDIRIFNKVIDISHYWGIYVFHSIVECLTKIGYYIDELLKDKSIVIHVPGKFIKKYLVFLGFNRTRLVSGEIYAKNLLSLERGPCGGSPSYLQVLSFRSYIRKRILAINDVKHKYDVVLIKRTGVRSIVNHDELLKTLQNMFGERSVVVFNGDEDLVNVFTFFTYAKLIVAPHGAGLSHIILCDYNTIVFEFLSVPGMNGCYAGLCINLGLKYYGLKYNTTDNKFIINTPQIKPLFEEFKRIMYN